MNKSKLSSRCRPGLGTLIRVQVSNEELFEPIYSRISEIESIFNFHEPTSELSRFNQNSLMPLSDEFQYLMNVATRLRLATRGAFTPYVEEQGGGFYDSIDGLKADLGGIAKGFAMDHAVETALKLDSRASGFVEAGGDIRYFGEDSGEVLLRLGAPPQVVTRELKIAAPFLSVATSSAGMAELYGATRTSLRSHGWPAGTTVTAIAKDCVLADALTKVVWFGGMAAFRAVEVEASVLVFDAQGKLLESATP